MKVHLKWIAVKYDNSLLSNNSLFGNCSYHNSEQTLYWIYLLGCLVLKTEKLISEFITFSFFYFYPLLSDLLRQANIVYGVHTCIKLTYFLLANTNSLNSNPVFLFIWETTHCKVMLDLVPVCSPVISGFIVSPILWVYFVTRIF